MGEVAGTVRHGNLKQSDRAGIVSVKDGIGPRVIRNSRRYRSTYRSFPPGRVFVIDHASASETHTGARSRVGDQTEENVRVRVARSFKRKENKKTNVRGGGEIIPCLLRHRDEKSTFTESRFSL